MALSSRTPSSSLHALVTLVPQQRQHGFFLLDALSEVPVRFVCARYRMYAILEKN